MKFTIIVLVIMLIISSKGNAEEKINNDCQVEYVKSILGSIPYSMTEEQDININQYIKDIYGNDDCKCEAEIKDEIKEEPGKD